MTKKTSFFFLLAILALSFCFFGTRARAAGNHSGQIVKMRGLTSLYYVAADGKRYVFPNENIYRSWFTDYDDVVTLSEEELVGLPLGGNVLYRPGVLLVKITTDPKVYAVTKSGVLRWIKTETIARTLYGDSWNKLVDDVPDSFFTNYRVGDEIDDVAEFDPENEIEDIDNIDANYGLSSANSLRAHTRKCQVVGNARQCRINDDDDSGNTSDLAITGITVNDKGDKGYIDYADEIIINFSEAVDPASINFGLTAGGYYTSFDYNIIGAITVSEDGVLTIKGVASFDLGSVDDSGQFAVKLSLSDSAKNLTVTVIAGSDIKIEDEDFEDARQIGGTVKDKAGNIMKEDYDIDAPNGTFGGEHVNDGIEPFISSIEVFNNGKDGYMDLNDEIRVTYSERIDPESVNNDLKKGASVDSVAYNKTGGVDVDKNGILTVADIASFYVGDVSVAGRFGVTLSLDSEGEVLTIILKSGSDIKIDNEDLDDARQIGGTIEDRDGNEMENDPNIDDPSGSFVEDSQGSDPYITHVKVYNEGYAGYVDVDDRLVITFSEELDPQTINKNLTAGGSVSDIDLDKTGGVYVNSDGIFTVTDILSFDIGEVAGGSNDFTVGLSLSSNGKILTVTITDGDSVGISSENFSQTTQIGGTIEDQRHNVMNAVNNIDDPNGTFGGDSADTPPYITEIEVNNGGDSGNIDVGDRIAITFNEAIDPKSVNKNLKAGSYVQNVDDDDTGGVIVEDNGTLTISDIAKFYVGDADDEGEFKVKLSLNSIGNILTVTLSSGDDIELNYEDMDDAEQTGGTIEDRDGYKMDDDPRITDPTGNF
ncbi:MAG: hypothetical protein V1867_06690 [Candidatus Falkowbacteria bacterium]